jgi:hypothetical protein
MHFWRLIWISCAVVSVILTVQAQAQMPKKLIEYGWDAPAPSYVAQNIRAMEELPFDGVVLKVPGLGSIFVNSRWNLANLQSEFSAMQGITWGKFTDNFVVMLSTSSMDWFNDAHWANIMANTGTLARAARLGRLKGFVLDPEPYGPSPWTYATQPRASTQSYAAYQGKVRQRGKQFMGTIQQNFPQPVVQVLYLMNLFSGLLSVPPGEARTLALKAHPYGLLPAFLDGMLDAAQYGTLINDGNEDAYFYTDAAQYYRAYRDIRYTAASFVSPDNTLKYRRAVRCAHGLYVDYVFNMMSDWWMPPYSRFLTAEERQRWFEYDTYYALKHSDTYAWMYSERLDWWKHTNIPAGALEAITSARAKIRAGQPLGFIINDLIIKAKAAIH